MSRIEQAAARADRELTPLTTDTIAVAPVLTPVAVAVGAGLVAGAVVGYVHEARHGAERVSHHEQLEFTGQPTGQSVAELLQIRNESMAA